MTTLYQLHSAQLGPIRVTHLDARQIVFDLEGDRARSFPAPHDTSELGIVSYIESQVANPPAPVVAPREINKLVTVERLISLGKVGAFMDFLDSNSGVLRLLWDSSNSLRTDHAMFTTYAPTFKAALELTEEQFIALLA